MSRSGFTLVELVIVAAVISILVALSIPVGTWAMMASREAGAIGALRTISTSQEAFRSTGMRDDNGDGAGDYGTLDELGAPPRFGHATLY